ncbi:MAG TPA: helix-turn-helix domain-containing protein [Candidatus Nanoarchaeia archaeon]|nr:helix-turn-helix domain-containing protein [Candidatus Nanoarchaeia archaeon]
MIVQESFLKKIKDFGLNSYEAKIWTALLSRGVSTAGELSDIAGVPRSRSYDILESLEKKGFIVMKLGKPIKYIAIPPEEVVERVKKGVDIQAQEQIKILDQLRGSDILKELVSLHTQGIEPINPADLSGVIKGRTQVYNHLNTMIKNASKSVVLMTSEDGLIRKHKHLGKTLRKASEKGVKIKILAPLTTKSKDAIKELSEFAEVKNSKGHTGRFCLIDNKELAFMLTDDTKVHPSYDTAVWVNASLFASTFGRVLEQCPL